MHKPVWHTAQHTHTRSERAQKQTQASVHTTRRERERERECSTPGESIILRPSTQESECQIRSQFALFSLRSIIHQGTRIKISNSPSKSSFLPFLAPTFDSNMLRVYECSVCSLSLRSTLLLFFSLSSVCHFLGIYANFPRNALSRLAEYYALCCASAS